MKKARIESRCEWCSEWITKGQPAVVTACLFEGEIYDSRLHPECREAIRRYNTKHKSWGESLPDFAMNRGGIEEKGEPEQPI